MEVEETFVENCEICEICHNPNDSIQDVFLYEIDKAIDSGNIIYIKNAIKDFGNLLDKSYIEWANSIALQIVEEKIDSMEI